MKWIFVGNLRSGEAIYWQKGGDLAVEKDHERLVDPTPEETAEIYDRMSHLRPTRYAGELAGCPDNARAQEPF
jgi:hypothetical protein